MPSSFAYFYGQKLTYIIPKHTILYVLIGAKPNSRIFIFTDFTLSSSNMVWTV